MKFDILRETPIIASPRVAQIGGIFDLAPSPSSCVRLAGELPLDQQPWHIGLIVGPSGSGKSTLLRELFGETCNFDWARDHTLLDEFPDDIGIREITELLAAVGFGTVPNWLRPFHVLSNGEQFRVTLARALAGQSTLIAIDEFTSVLDRQIAQVASHAVQRAVRRRDRRLVAASCHYDVIPWLRPDWVYEPHRDAFEWRSLQRRPEIAIEIRTIDRELWSVFSRYHYLSHWLDPRSICIGGFVDGNCVAFTSAVRFPHPRARDIWREHRTVVLPDWQGLGLAGRMSDWLGLELAKLGWRFHSVTAHPAIIRQKAASPRWRLLRYGTTSEGGPNADRRHGRRRQLGLGVHQSLVSARRITASFVFVAPPGTALSAELQSVDGLRNRSVDRGADRARRRAELKTDRRDRRRCVDVGIDVGNIGDGVGVDDVKSDDDCRHGGPSPDVVIAA